MPKCVPDPHVYLPLGLAVILALAVAHPSAAVDHALERHAAETVLVEGADDCPASDIADARGRCDWETEKLMEIAIEIACGSEGGQAEYVCTEHGAILWNIRCNRDPR